jgi:AcrR family transcriptional regulator
MAPRPDVSEERKKQILDAATEVFNQKGFDRARMEDIVEKTGLSKGTLYWYFKSKSQIITAILDRIFQAEFDELEMQKDANVGAAEAILQYTESAIGDFSKMMRLMPIAYEFLALAFRNSVVQEALRRYFSRYIRATVPIIQRGIDTGEFRPVDAQDAAIAIGAIFEGTILLWVYDKTMVKPERNIRLGINLLVEGIKA